MILPEVEIGEKEKERKKAKSFRRKIERDRFLFNPTDSKGVGPSKVFVEEVEKVHCDPIGNSFERSNSRNDTNRFVSTTILRILATVNTILSIDSRSLSLHSVDTNAGDRRTLPLSSPYKNFVPTKLSLKNYPCPANLPTEYPPQHETIIPRLEGRRRIIEKLIIIFNRSRKPWRRSPLFLPRSGGTTLDPLASREHKSRKRTPTIQSSR